MSSGDQRTGPGADGGGRTASIVRYPNRRLYDRSQGRYVTLPEIAAMVREGKSVTVRDSKTDEDLTGLILTQILLEQHPERVGLFPVPVLHLMLRSNDIVLGFLREYLRQSLLYLELWQRVATLGPMAAPMEWMKAFLPTQPTSSAPAPQAGAEALAQRIAELERRLAALGASDDGEAGSDRDMSGRNSASRKTSPPDVP